jgi:hypothetical protein
MAAAELAAAATEAAVVTAVAAAVAMGAAGRNVPFLVSISGYFNYCFESGSGLDPDSIRSVDPDSVPDPGGPK